MKKKELTLQDIFNQNNELYRNIVDCFIKLEEKLTEISECSKTEQPVAEKNSESEIPNTAYVTLTEDGCFVGGEPTTQYNGEDIYRPYLCVAYFKEARDIIREEYGYELLELHCLQSSTGGEYAKTDDPVPDKEGTFCWCRCVWQDKNGVGASSSWVFLDDYGSASICANNCANFCASNVQNDRDFRGALFGSLGA